MTKEIVTLEDIKKASKVLDGVARKTDLIYSPALSGENQIYLKTENLQLTGSFKLRGAYNMISNMSEEDKAKGLVACSAGNHAQGVALASKRNGLKCIICMPSKAPISKVEATKSYGAEVVLVPDSYDDAHDEAERLVKEEGYTLVHPFDDPAVIAGQGTIGLEITEQLEDVDAVVVPIGGGGLISGVATAVKAIKPDCKVYGVQAVGANAMAKSYQAKNIISTEKANTFADGIAVKTPGDNTFKIISEKVDGVVTVTEDEIATAILKLVEKQKLVAEGAGAVSVAAVMFNKIPLMGKNIACVVSGGNIDVNTLDRVISKGLVMADRRINIRVEMDDKQGSLSRACAIVSECGGNILEVRHDRTNSNLPINTAIVTFELEIRDASQARFLRETLESEGYNLL